MTATARAVWKMGLVSVFLKLLSVGYLIVFVSWIALILLNAPILAAGSKLAPLLRFQPYNPHMESMITAIYIVWAVMMWRASTAPARHHLFIDFTMWASVAHGLVMVIATPIQKGFVMTLIEGVPMFVIAGILWWLRPGYSPDEGQSTVTQDEAETC